MCKLPVWMRINQQLLQKMKWKRIPILNFTSLLYCHFPDMAVVLHPATKKHEPSKFNFYTFPVQFTLLGLIALYSLKQPDVGVENLPS